MRCATRRGHELLHLASYMAVMNAAHSLFDTYAPALPIHRWAPIRAFACDVVRQYAPGRSEEATRLALGTLTYFADWVMTVAISTLEASLTENLIDVYTQERQQEISATLAQRERKLLRTLGGFAPVVENGRSIKTTSPSHAPYSAASLLIAARWAANQPTPYQRRSCTALLALALGCGLTTKQIGEVRDTDIIHLPTGGYAVAAMHPTRLVPVQIAYEHYLAEYADQNTGSHLVCPKADDRARAARTAISSSRGDVAPTPERLRATWMVAHLNNRTPIVSLLEAAGLTAADSLKRYLPFVAPVPAEIARPALRLAEGAW